MEQPDIDAACASRLERGIEHVPGAAEDFAGEHAVASNRLIPVRKAAATLARPSPRVSWKWAESATPGSRGCNVSNARSTYPGKA